MLRIPLLPLLLLCACDQPSEASTDAPSNVEETDTVAILVRTAPVLIQDIEEFIEAVANTHSLDQVDVFPERVEPILTLHVEEGEVVQKGQVLAELRKDVASLALDEAETRMVEAENDVERTRRDFGRNQQLAETQGGTSLLSDRDLDASRQAMMTAKSALETGRVAVGRAELDLNRCTLRAPISGTVTAREISVGGMTNMATRAFQIVDLSQPRVIFYRPQREMALLRVGQLLLGTSEALPGQDITGAIERISPVVDAESGTIKVTALLDKEFAGMPTGILMRLRIILDRHENARLIPKRALMHDADGIHCFAIREGKAVLLTVIPGFEDSEYMEDLGSELQPDDSIVIVGTDRLEEGDLVDISNES
jgi:membrane fusion protein (multidrug efflux system)